MLFTLVRIQTHLLSGLSKQILMKISVSYLVICDRVMNCLPLASLVMDNILAFIKIHKYTRIQCANVLNATEIESVYNYSWSSGPDQPLVVIGIRMYTKTT